MPGMLLCMNTPGWRQVPGKGIESCRKQSPRLPGWGCLAQTIRGLQKPLGNQMLVIVPANTHTDQIPC
jgi:hypothetical protein